MAKPTRKIDRLLDAQAAQDEQDASIQLYGERARDMRFLHVVLAQCGLPYRNQDADTYQRQNGNLSLLLSAGELLNPKSKNWEKQGLPYGSRPRLLMLHLCTEAVRTQSASIEIGSSMSGLMVDLGLTVTGGKTGSIGRFKDQLNRLAASRIQFGRISGNVARMVNPAPMIEHFDVWFPTEPGQRILWPSELKLGKAFFESLQESALPVDLHAVRALQASSMKLDIYTWLAHRLCRIPGNKPSLISWEALRQQFGQDFASTPQGDRNFRAEFRKDLAAVKAVYRDANVSEGPDGRLELRQSKPPIPKIVIGK